jgi:hypothetical protein
MLTTEKSRKYLVFIILYFPECSKFFQLKENVSTASKKINILFPYPANKIQLKLWTSYIEEKTKNKTLEDGEKTDWLGTSGPRNMLMSSSDLLSPPVFQTSH